MVVISALGERKKGKETFKVCDGPVIHMPVQDVTDLGPNIVDIKSGGERKREGFPSLI